MNEIENETLSVFCFDTLEVIDKMTFDSATVKGMNVTYWMENDTMEERMNNAFDILFEEIIMARNIGKKEEQ